MRKLLFLIVIISLSSLFLFGQEAEQYRLKYRDIYLEKILVDSLTVTEIANLDDLGLVYMYMQNAITSKKEQYENIYVNSAVKAAISTPEMFMKNMLYLSHTPEMNQRIVDRLFDSKHLDILKELQEKTEDEALAEYINYLLNDSFTNLSDLQRNRSIEKKDYYARLLEEKFEKMIAQFDPKERYQFVDSLLLNYELLKDKEEFKDYAVDILTDNIGKIENTDYLKDIGSKLELYNEKAKADLPENLKGKVLDYTFAAKAEVEKKLAEIRKIELQKELEEAKRRKEALEKEKERLRKEREAKLEAEKLAKAERKRKIIIFSVVGIALLLIVLGIWKVIVTKKDIERLKAEDGDFDFEENETAEDRVGKEKFKPEPVIVKEKTPKEKTINQKQEQQEVKVEESEINTERINQLAVLCSAINICNSIAADLNKVPLDSATVGCLLLEQAAKELDQINIEDKLLVEKAVQMINLPDIKEKAKADAKKAFLKQFKVAMAKPEVVQKFNLTEVRQTVFNLIRDF